MEPSSNEFYEEVIEEEEYFEDDGDGDSMGDEELLAFVRTSLQDEYRQRLEKPFPKSAAKSSVVDICEESPRSSLPVAVEDVVELEISSDSTSVYEEVVLGENSFSVIGTYIQGPIGSSQVGEQLQEQSRDEAYVESRKSCIQQLSQQPKAAKQESLSACGSCGSQTGLKAENVEEIEEETFSESDYEEQVVERWFGNWDQEPENLEAACRVLIPIIYRGESVCADTMIKRTPLSELYKYLKQHYDYKKEIKKDLTDEDVKAETPQMSVQELFRMRSSGKAHLPERESAAENSPLTVNEVVSKQKSRLTSMSSPRKIRSPWGKAKKGVKMNSTDIPSCSSFDDSQVIYEEISITDFEDSCIVLEESESVFEEIVEETQSSDVEVVVDESISEVEETIHEDDCEVEHQSIDCKC